MKRYKDYMNRITIDAEMRKKIIYTARTACESDKTGGYAPRFARKPSRAGRYFAAIAACVLMVVVVGLMLRYLPLKEIPVIAPPLVEVSPTPDVFVSQIMEKISARQIVEDHLISGVEDKALAESIQEYNRRTSEYSVFFKDMAVRTMIWILEPDGCDDNSVYEDLPVDVQELVDHIVSYSLYASYTELFLADSLLKPIIESEAGGSSGQWVYWWHTEYLNDTPEMRTALTEYFRLIDDLSLQLGANADTPVSAEPWMEAYTAVLLDAGDNLPRLIALMDITRDGVPELFFAELGTVNSYIYRGFSYANGQIQDINILQGWMMPDLELYREKETNTIIWIAGGTMRGGWGEYSHEWYTIDFSDLSAVEQTHLFGWTERFDNDEDLTHYFFDANDETGNYESVEETSLSEILARQEQVFVAYELLETYDPYMAITEFIIDDDGLYPAFTKENYNKPLLMEYFANWEQYVRPGPPRNRAAFSDETPSANLPAAEIIPCNADEYGFFKEFELEVTLKNGEILNKVYEYVSFYVREKNSIKLNFADLNGDGNDEIILFVPNATSNYDATNIHVLRIDGDGLTEILTLLDSHQEQELITFKDSLHTIPRNAMGTELPLAVTTERGTLCTGAKLVPSSDGTDLCVYGFSKTTMPYSIIRWNGRAWYVTEQAEPSDYEITARLHEYMPEYIFRASGLTIGTDEWSTGYILGLEVYDDKGEILLYADFSWVEDGRIFGNYAFNNMMDTMGLHVVDVNFDGYKDVIIFNDYGGAHSNSWYDCWLWDAETSSFVTSESFTAICNPALDPEKKYIYSSGGSGAEFWGGSVYRFINGEFVMTDNLDGSWRRVVESRYVDGEMKVVREVALDDDTEKVREQQTYYANDDFWQWQLGNLDSRWYMYGGHHADQWLGG